MLIELCDICGKEMGRGGFAIVKFVSHYPIFGTTAMGWRYEVGKPNDQYCICYDCRYYLVNMKDNVIKVTQYVKIKDELYSAQEELRKYKNKNIWQKIFNK